MVMNREERGSDSISRVLRTGLLGLGRAGIVCLVMIVVMEGSTGERDVHALTFLADAWIKEFWTASNIARLS